MSGAALGIEFIPMLPIKSFKLLFVMSEAGDWISNDT